MVVLPETVFIVVLTVFICVTVDRVDTSPVCPIQLTTYKPGGNSHSVLSLAILRTFTRTASFFRTLAALLNVFGGLRFS